MNLAGSLCSGSNDSGNSARRRGGIINARHRSSVLCSSFLTSTCSTTTATMPATVMPRVPMKKALCIGIEYRELAANFPQLHLPAAHLDPKIMAGLLQGGSC